MFLVVPIPATCTSSVVLEFRKALRMWVLAELVDRYLVKAVFVAVSAWFALRANSKAVPFFF
jgi:hypothetical protein